LLLLLLLRGCEVGAAADRGDVDVGLTAHTPATRTTMHHSMSVCRLGLSNCKPHDSLWPFRLFRRWAKGTKSHTNHTSKHPTRVNGPDCEAQHSLESPSAASACVAAAGILLHH
jgi:hypothetical protein